MNRKELIDDLVKNEIVNAISNGSKVEDLIDELGFSVDKMKSKKGDDKLKLIKNTELLISFLKDCINPSEEEVQKMLSKPEISLFLDQYRFDQEEGENQKLTDEEKQYAIKEACRVLYTKMVDILEGRMKILNTAPPTDNIVDRLLKQIN
jgi:hypothetical protein